VDEFLGAGGLAAAAGSVDAPRTAPDRPGGRDLACCALKLELP